MIEVDEDVAVEANTHANDADSDPLVYRLSAANTGAIYYKNPKAGLIYYKSQLNLDGEDKF